jgi:hypothetical protein
MVKLNSMTAIIFKLTILCSSKETLSTALDRTLVSEFAREFMNLLNEKN